MSLNISGNSGDDTNENKPKASSATHQQVKTIELHDPGSIWSVAFLVDGENMVGCGDEGTIRRRQVENGEPVGMPVDADGAIYDLAVSRDGRWVVAGTYNGVVTVLSAESFEKVAVFRGHNNWILSVDVSSDGTKIVTGSRDCSACLWSLSTTPQRLLGPWRHGSEVASVKFSPDGSLVAASTWKHSAIWIYDNENGHLVVQVSINVCQSFGQSLVWANDSKRLFVLTRDGHINCLDVFTGTALSRWPIHSNYETRCIALTSNGAVAVVSADSSLSFWDTTTHMQIGSIIQKAARIESIAISADYDLAIGEGNRITLLNLCDIFPSSYSNNIFAELATQRVKELKKTIKSLRAQNGGSNANVVSLKETVQQLRRELADSQGRAYNLKINLESLRAQDNDRIAHMEQQLWDSQRKSDCFAQIISAYEQKHQCEFLYSEHRIIDSAILLVEITNAMSEGVTETNGLIMDWLAKFKSQCISELETTGDDASRVGDHDKAVTAYSTALLLGPPTPSILLAKWADILLIRVSGDEALSAAVKFRVPRFAVYRAVCHTLEGDGRILDAVHCFKKSQTELGEGQNYRFAPDETEWVTNFKARWLKTFEQRGDDAMDSASCEDAIVHYTTALALDPSSTELLTKRSKARAAAGLWEDALEDSDAVISLDPSSPSGYERKYLALFGVRRFDEAIDAFNHMLLRLEQSPDPATRELRNNYVSPEQTIAAVRASMKRTQRDSPLVLINTETGRLCDQQARADVFEADTKFKELLASIVTKHDNSRIAQTVQLYFRYATFSHTWEGAEPLFHDLLHQSVDGLAASPRTFKLMMFCTTAREAGFRWAWSDTCCINKADSSVLQESLTSMFEWYHRSALTIIHLKGVLSDSELGALERSLWNTRAWTLQEFFASRVIQFYTEDWKRYRPQEHADNDKESSAVMREMAAATGVDEQVLLSLRPGSENVRQKLCLAAKRIATRQEDIAYSLFGIFDVSIQVNYGEGQQRALGRLLQEVLTRSGDVTILAWTGKASEYNSCLPADLGVYSEPASPCVPSVIGHEKMDSLVGELRTPSYLDSAVMLYDQITALPSPRLVSRRLSLSCIIFRPRGHHVSKVDSPGVYRFEIPGLGTVEVETTEDLSGLKKLALVHPWLKSLLDPSEDPSEDSDVEPFTPIDEQDRIGGHAPPSPRTPLLSYDKPTRALRLFARLRQPFGALLLSHQSHNDYRRVASDRPIHVQLQSNVLPRHLAQMIRTVDIL